jgi:hypothetical protein
MTLLIVLLLLQQTGQLNIQSGIFAAIIWFIHLEYHEKK